MVFLRFVVDELHLQSGKRCGAFQAAYRLRRSGLLSAYDEQRLSEALTWFDEHLPKPVRLAHSRRPNATDTAICWFRAGAREHLSRMRELQSILDIYAVRLEMVVTRRPGYIVYEDAFQVAAYPFAETAT